MFPVLIGQDHVPSLVNVCLFSPSLPSEMLSNLGSLRSFGGHRSKIPFQFVSFLHLLCLLPYFTAARCDVKTYPFIKRVLFGSQESGRFEERKGKKREKKKVAVVG